jgi:hypothetical protein
MLKFSIVFTQPGPQKEPGLFQDFDIENLEREHQYQGTPGNGEENDGKGDENLQQEDIDPEKAIKDVSVRKGGMSGMKIAVDYDGTLTLNPAVFKKLLSRLAKAGTKLYLVTGRPEVERDQIESFVKTYGMKFDKMFFYPIAYKYNGISWDITRDIRIGRWKAKVVKDLHADVIIDDNPIYISQVLKSVPEILVLMPRG